MSGLPGIPEAQVPTRAKPKRAPVKLRVGMRGVLDVGDGGRPFVTVAELLPEGKVRVEFHELRSRPDMIVPATLVRA
jgi:hypothetical protein